ncbi:peptide-methionine (S)-S-oxide reductase [Verrucomicrobium sp. GAS474]|uniref:peptide-methionine (S)-S-oxide reductase MsrA n=1 Tax=Verrucomicrobium sp. GAS474 TaxID=1882831 RepID=UPI0008793645|nr:peptide-methionine (S)-S-oxide reductase MsrA [Verrucomicrobium sp. GAS474]SDU07947.1 peptide-methionine (S)-S-oxide reductase [Verrucomicrobium sp. GAS474]
MSTPLQTATLGMGCFWCTEAFYRRFAGVKDALCGYAGGARPNPSYESVCTGASGHAEVARITFDPVVLTYGQILDIFWEVHDPTTLNRQGADAGTQYRSVIFYENEEQHRIAEASKAAAAARFESPIVTEISPLPPFYPAEDEHQDYFRKHPRAPYCSYVISPKIEKLLAHPPVPLAKV